ncbi:DUF58 domain-containing protein [Persicimonas caeni]|uniref:DUF58 domain-containing protein n=1 Tax=Persicimonas caeni TaxID=2292766 RepID=A0A4Y6PRC0_PERCE|nr:DUF58 domain-containing protein [Persicimonas caeni]QDG50861.1 DUF58 domain-containing protein [Persicimonas caeni]QED32082.1 DUF58 domain-containing protein [Persicimonas caeni]
MTETLRQQYLDPAVLDELGTMQVRARMLVEGILAGLHRSPHHGGSVEFAEYVEYSPGHEIRHIDWKVYAKTDKYYVKQYEDETNLRAYMVVDGSGSMRFKSEEAPISKLDYASYLSAAFAHLLLRQGDAVGALSFNADQRQFLPASARKNHLDDIFYLLDNQPAAGKTGLDHALRTIAERANRRSVVFIVSDFLDADGEAMQLLKVLRHRRLDVAAFHVVDPAEITLPYEGMMLFEGMEGEGELLVDVDDLRDAYTERMREHMAFVKQQCEQADIEYLRFPTTQPIEQTCLTFLRGRI